MGKSKKDYCTFSPEKLFGVYYGDPCCKQHDLDYSLSGKIERRIDSDVRLRICIAEHFLSYGWSLRLAKVVSGVYYRVVRLTGWWFWKTWDYKENNMNKKKRWLQRWNNLK